MGARDNGRISKRVAVVGQLLAHAGEHRLVTGLGREIGIARQTLYTWREQGRLALEQAFAPPARDLALSGAGPGSGTSPGWSS